MNKNLPLRILFPPLLAASTYADEETVLVSSNFDDSTPVGPAFQQVANGLGQGGMSDGSTGVITAGNVATSTFGLNTGATVDATSVAGSTGFEIEFVVTSVTNAAAIQSNGMFFGVSSNTDATGTDGPSLYNNNPDSIGIGFFGANANFGAEDAVRFIQETDGFNVQDPGIISPTIESLEDGFTITLQVNEDDTWSASSSGLSDDFNVSGTLDTTVSSYAMVANNLVPNVSIQGLNTGLVLDSVTFTATCDPLGTSDGVIVTNSVFTDSGFEVSFEGLDPSVSYQLVRGTDLISFDEVVEGARLPVAASDTFIDPSPIDRAFYILEEVPNE